jgi:hypothetical protein
MAQTAVLGLSDQAGARVKSSTAAESIDLWIDGFNDERSTNERGDKMVGCSTGLQLSNRS